MNLYVYTAAPTLANAVATNLGDLNDLIAASADPLDTDNANTLARIASTIPEMTVGDGQALTVYAYSGTNTLASWSGVAGHSVTVGLGLLDLNGDQLFTAATLNVTTNGFTGTLSLNTPTLISRVRGAITDGYGKGRWFSSPVTSARFPIHLRHTDTNGSYETIALWSQLVRDRVLTNGSQDSDPQPSTTYLTLAEAVALFSPRTQGYNTVSNSSGTTNISPSSNVFHLSQIVNVSGSGNTTRVVALLTTGRASGDLVSMRLNLPATSGITAEVRNASDAGTLLSSITTDGSGDDAAIDYVFDGSAWSSLRATYPA
jgi:hypothetical protein